MDIESIAEEEVESCLDTLQGIRLDSPMTRLVILLHIKRAIHKVLEQEVKDLRAENDRLREYLKI